MTSEDKYVLSQLTNETGNLKGILKQQNKIENMASSMLDAVIRYADRVKRTELKKRFGTFRKTIPLRFLLGKG